MLEETIIEKTIAYAKSIFLQDYSGHDYWHTIRVYNTATKLAKIENANMFVVQLASLLHDVDDVKISPQTHKNKDNAVSFMSTAKVDKSVILSVCEIIDDVSFRGKETITPTSIEGKCVQDADRLDAIGAIGIARAFAFGGNNNRAIYDPNIKPNVNMSEYEYRHSPSTTINHFYEKLFKIKQYMNLDSSIKIAEHREDIMKKYIDEFLLEWNGEL